MERQLSIATDIFKKVGKKRLVLLLALAGVFLVSVPTALAAQPVIERTTTGSVFLDASRSSCGFPVLFAPTHQDLLQIFDFGNGRLLFTGALTMTATNLDTGKSVSVDLSGNSKLTFNSDGSVSFSNVGGTVYIPPSSPGFDTLTLFQGRFAQSFDSQGNLVSTQLAGTATDLCAVLGP
jgi:hypothetical protein